MCNEQAAPRNREDSKLYASIDADKEMGPVFNIEIVTVFDVPGVEVQVNEIHRHNSDIMNYKTSMCASNLPNLPW